MALREVKLPWRAQPYVPAELSLASREMGLRYALTPVHQPYVRGYPGDPMTQPTEGTPHGRAWVATGYESGFIPLDPMTSDQWTVMGLCQMTYAPGDYGSPFDLNDGLWVAESRINLQLPVYGGGEDKFGMDTLPYGRDGTSSFVVDHSAPHVYGITIHSGRNEIAYYVDGVLVRLAGISGAAPITLSMLQLFGRAGGYGNAARARAGSKVWMVAGGTTALTPGQMAEIGRNPWSIFKPQSLWVPKVSGPVTITGTLARTLGATIAAAVGEKVNAKVGALAKSTGASTLVSTGTLAVMTGSGAVTAVTSPTAVAATSKLATKGTLNRMVASAALVSASKLAVRGSLGRTLSPSMLASAANLRVKATLSRFLSGAALVANSKLSVKGSMSRTLASAAVTGASKLTLKGQAGVALPSAVLSSTGVIRVTDSGSVSLRPANVVASTSAKLALKGTSTVQLGANTASVRGKVTLKGFSAILLGSAQVYASTGLNKRGQAAMLLSPATLASLGIVVTPGANTANIQLANATVSVSARSAVKGNFSVNLAAATLMSGGQLLRVPIQGYATVNLGNTQVRVTGFLYEAGFRLTASRTIWIMSGIQTRHIYSGKL